MRVLQYVGVFFAPFSDINKKRGGWPKPSPPIWLCIALNLTPLDTQPMVDI